MMMAKDMNMTMKMIKQGFNNDNLPIRCSSNLLDKM